MASSIYTCRPSIIIQTAAAVILALAIATYKLLRLHKRLSCSIVHKSYPDVLAQQHIISMPVLDKAESSSLRHLPQAIRNSPADFRTAYDTASLPVLASQLPSHLTPQHMLTLYMRHNMALFSRLPQAYALFYMTQAEHRHTFDKAYIRKLDFEPGNVVNGVYQTISNNAISDDSASGWRIVMRMAIGDVDGRLVFTLLISPSQGSEVRDEEVSGSQTGEESAVFSTETWMWIPRDSKSVMPLERTVAKWAHEVTSWWLIEKGAAYLQELNAKETVAEMRVGNETK